MTAASDRQIADPRHLLFNRVAQVVQDVETVGDLPRPRGALTRALRVQPAPVMTYGLHFGVLREPIRRCLRRTLRDHVDDLPSLQVDDDRRVGPALAPTPVVNADDTDRRCGACNRAAFQVPQDRVIAGRDREAFGQPRGGTPAGGMAEHLQKLYDAAASARRGCLRGA